MNINKDMEVGDIGEKIAIELLEKSGMYATKNKDINTRQYYDIFAFVIHSKIHNKIKYWIHGHMHSNVDYMIGDTRVVCNPRGYSDMENVKFDPRMELIV